jgi:hypothetical protein
MPSKNDMLQRFDNETQVRRYSMTLGGFSPAEVSEYVEYRENRRIEIIEAWDREPVIWRR